MEKHISFHLVTVFFSALEFLFLTALLPLISADFRRLTLKNGRDLSDKDFRNFYDDNKRFYAIDNVIIL